jgi:hypothetical protein
MHAALTALGRTPLSDLGVTNGHRSIDGKAGTPEELGGFDSNLICALGLLAKHLFVENTNATYPMKAALLVTGLMPAFDSKVRRGLQRGGLLGMDKTQYLLPADASGVVGKQLTRLPFLLGECWTACARQLREGVDKSRFPDLVSEPGRIFDVLLFMQADWKIPVLLSCQPPTRGWYTFA